MSYSQRADQGYLSLAKGLVTESSALAAVEGSTSDELNMTLDTNGMIRKRRKGLESKSKDFLFEGTHVGGYYWEAKNHVILLHKRDATIDDIAENFENFLVVTFTFYEDVFPQPINAIVYEYAILVEKEEFVTPQFAEIRDRVICTYGGEPTVFRINDDGLVSIWNIRLFIRDFKLLNDGLRISERPSTNPDVHKYNLYNAGWWQHRRLKGDPVVLGDPIGKFFTDRNVYPSNSDVAYIGDITDANGDLIFDPMSYDNVDQGNSEAPRGHYVYSIRRIDRQSKIVSKTNDGTPNRTLVPILIDGDDPSTGAPPPSGDPIYTPPPTCNPGENCTIEP